MKLFCILRDILLLSVVALGAATSVSQLACVKRTLTVTVDDYVWPYFDGVEITGLPNFDQYDIPDVVDFPCATRLIAIHGRNRHHIGGILASTDDEYILTNSSWKCSNVSYPGWEQIGFDDSNWVFGLDFGNNGQNDWVDVPGISSNAAWIWLRQWDPNLDPLDTDVYCRKSLDPNFCAISNPCLFGSTCIDEPNGEYHCNCAPGYTGKNCSTEINFCESDPCASGGSCLPIFNGYVCQCQPGFTGDNCEYVINNCESFPCLNGGTCLNGVNYFVCVCPPESTGVRCETVINTCDPNPCLNGGSCSNQGGSPPTCTCPIFATGVKCESPNYQEAYACGTTLTWTQYEASNDFTRLCYYWTPPEDIAGRNTECRDTIQGIPLYGDYVGLMDAGGNFGCIVAQNDPADLPEASRVACADNYQQDVSLGNYSATDRMMVCIRYPYEGIPGRK